MNPEVIAQGFLILGASIFLILGVFHGGLTLQDLTNPSTFTPLDVELREAMQRSSIAIHPQANLWRAWLGFNLSHSLGLVMFGGTFLNIGLFHFSVFNQNLYLQICALLISITYLLMSLKFWFYKPVIGSGLALICFMIAVGLSIL
jgi:hypothetical protein